MATEIIRKIYTLTAGQTTVNLTSSLTGFWTVNVVDGNTDNGPLVNFSDNTLNYDYTVINDFEIELQESYPAGTQLIVTTNGASSFAPGSGVATVIDWLILYVPDPLIGKPLFNGDIYVGQPDFDPEIVSNQKQLYVVQEDNTQIAVPQPFQLSSGGVPTYNGSAVRLAVEGNYSIKILSKQGVQKYYFPNVLEGAPVTTSTLGELSCLKMDSKANAIAYGFSEGNCFVIPSIAYAKYIVRSPNYILQVGDLQLDNGLKAELQAADDGCFNVLWFDADSSLTNQYVNFDLAAQRALQSISSSASGLNIFGPVRVPAANWTLSDNVPTPAYWHIDQGAEFQGNPNWGNSNADSLIQLTGRILQMPARNAGGSMQLGATDLTWINDIRPTILGTSELQVVSATGEPGALFATRTSDNPAATEGTIGVKCYVANDKEGTGKTVGYGQYKESIRWPDAGTTFCEETNITTYGDLEVLYPGSVPGNALGICVNYWVGGPVGSGPLEVPKAMTSAGIAFGGGSATQDGKNVGFDAGIVFTNKAFETSVEKEIFRSGRGMKWALYSDGAERKGYIEGIVNQTSFNGQYNIMVREGTGEERMININPNALNPDDNQFSCGDATHRWTEVFAINSSINTSDRNEKEQESAIEQSLKEAALEVKGIIKKWKWKAAVESKGDSARWHIGPIAQDVQQAFESRGVDPFEYGFLGFDEILDESGKPTGEVRMNIRHTELQYLIMAAEV